MDPIERFLKWLDGGGPNPPPLPPSEPESPPPPPRIAIRINKHSEPPRTPLDAIGLPMEEIKD
jgi:hypothetical protein